MVPKVQLLRDAAELCACWAAHVVGPGVANRLPGHHRTVDGLRAWIAELEQGAEMPPDPQLQEAVEALLWQLHDRETCASCHVSRTPQGWNHRPGCRIAALDEVLNSRVPTTVRS